MGTSEQLEKVYECVDALVDFAHRHLKLDERDDDWAHNRLLALLSLDGYSPTSATAGDAPVSTMLHDFCDAAVQAGLFASEESGAYADAVMGILTPRPSQVQDDFLAVERESDSMEAMQWLYDLCVNDSYVKRAQLEANPRFESHGLVVTINTAKPEFKNMSKAASGNSVAGGYPLCTICHANEGFAGRAKSSLRTIPVNLDGESWFWQFSPYGYFNQHGICVNDEHTPMYVDRFTFVKLLDFVDRFPGYFLGCNAALPRIGGSVLAHDHYQGGGERLPMHTAQAWCTFSTGVEDAIVEILDWPGTAVRVVSKSRERIVEISDAIRQSWVSYENAQIGILPEDEDGRRSAVSPSLIITERGYEMSLIFRNNAVSEEFPEGVFHAHPEFWPVKQEPIGLIEAQGLFILPGRLIAQLAAIEDALVNGQELPSQLEEFSIVWDELQRQLGDDRSANRVHEAVQDELGSVCFRILENTAVFKTKELTVEFLENLGFVKE